MEDKNVICLKNVWKKYSKEPIFHRCLREDLMILLKFKRSQNGALKKNEFWALKGINLNVKKGETLGLYGPNGSGKSTILKLIAKVTYPTKGNVLVKGKVAPLIEVGAGFHPDLSGRENIFVNGTILGMKIKEIKEKMDSIIEFAEIKDFIDMPIKKYSSGMYLRLGFSVAIHSSADIFLIDEILTVGDKGFQQKCLKKILELKDAGKTILFVSHDFSLMEKVVDKIAFIEKGKLIKVVNNNNKEKKEV